MTPLSRLAHACPVLSLQVHSGPQREGCGLIQLSGRCHDLGRAEAGDDADVFGEQPVDEATGEGVEPEAEAVFAAVQGRRGLASPRRWGRVPAILGGYVRAGEFEAL